jgi:hypothetical protein
MNYDENPGQMPGQTTGQTNEKKWKQLFEGALNRLNGREVPLSQQPIARMKRSATMECDSKEAISAAAQSLAALWQVSSPKRQGA